MEVYQDIDKLKRMLSCLSKERLAELLNQDFYATTPNLADEYQKAIREELNRREGLARTIEPTVMEKNTLEISEKKDVMPRCDELNKDYMWEQPSKQKLSRAQWLIIILALLGLISAGISSLQQTQRVDTFSELREVVERHTKLPIIPNWAPEGTILDGEVSVSERSDGLKISGVYYTESGQLLHIRIILRDEIPAKYEGLYQINDEPVVEYIIGGVTHYLMQNFDNNMAVWINDRAEVLIQGQCPMDDLKQMIDSLY